MARFRGSLVKKSRRLGIPLSDKAARIMEKRPNPPGQHGGRMKHKMSDLFNFALSIEISLHIIKGTLCISGQSFIILF